MRIIGKRTYAIGEKWGSTQFRLVDRTGTHTEYNRRYPKHNNYAIAEVTQNPAFHKPDGGWLGITLSEYGESDGGNGRSKTISLTLDKDEARALYQMLKDIHEPG